MKIEEIPLNGLEIHKLATRTPAMNEEQFNALKLSLEENGQLEPIRLYRSKVVDGRHRVKALRELGKETVIATYENPSQSIEDIENKIVYGWENRRHQSPTQKAIAAYYEWLRLNSEGIKTSQGEVAERMGTNRKMLNRAKTLAEYAPPEIMDILFNGGKINIGIPGKAMMTDSLYTLINYFKSRTDEMMAASVGGSTGEFTDKEQTMLYNKADELINEIGPRLARQLANILYGQTKEPA